MAAESPTHLELEIGHVLFMDVIGYSKLLINEQRELQQQLNQIVRNAEHFRAAERAGKLIRLPVGDGMALAFFDSPEAPVQCALEITEALKACPQLQLRMGIHSGPVSGVTDVNDRSNMAGAGINMAQRIMDCGDAGHILLSKRIADDLAQDGWWRPQLHDLGECSVKHGVGLFVVNLYTDRIGNPQLPEKIKIAQQQQAAAAAASRPPRFRRRNVFIASAVLLAAALALFIYERQPFGSSPRELIPQKSIAVLPLENLSEEKENAYFADGIQDELLSNLSKIKDLKVISRTSVIQYKSGITRNLKEIAQQLGVGHIVEGSVRRVGDRVRVSVQLIDARTDRHLWVQNYDRTLADSITLQDELATEIAAALGAKLSAQEKARVEAKPTNNPGAYDAYLRGRAFTGGSPFDKPTVDGAIHSYQEAVKLDPGFALAWAYLSRRQSEYYWLGFDPSPARLAAAKDALDRALALDPNLPETHLALGYYRYYGQRDFTGALVEFQQAEQGLPNNVDVIRAIGLIQRRLTHWDEAIAGLRRAVELDPRNIDASLNLAITYKCLRRFPEALATFDRVLALEPTNTSALSNKAGVFWATGDLKSVELLLTNPGIDPGVRGVQALFERRDAAAVEMLSKALADKPVEEGRFEDRTWLRFTLGVSQQR